MSPPQSTRPDQTPAGRAADAWKEYMIRGRTPRVMDPRDEMRWFEVAQTRVILDVGTATDWQLLADTDSARVGLIISNATEYSTAKDGFFNGSTIAFDAVKDAGVPPNYTLFVHPGMTYGTGFDTTNARGNLYIAFGAKPAGLFTRYGHLLPIGSSPWYLSQRDHGSLCQGQVWGLGDTVDFNAAITEIILSDFPKQ